MDRDGDGIRGSFDNCIDVANGPLASTGSCDSQLDGDLDGYGNICDSDVDNDGATGLDDVSIAFADAAVVKTPGRSALACSGSRTLRRGVDGNVDRGDCER